MGVGTQFMLGGLLSGVGRGMEMDIVQQRATALERLRQQYETQREDRADQRLQDRDKRTQGYALDRAEVDQGHAVERLRVGGEIQSDRDRQQHGYEVDMARLTSSLQQARTAAEISLRDRLDDGDVHSVEVDGEGNYVIVRNDGSLEPTRVSARPLASATNTAEGGRLTQDERETAFRAAHRAWVQHGRAGREPTAEDFIGMTREDYRRIYGGDAGGGTGAQGTGATPPRRIRFDAQGRRIGG